MFGGFNQRFFSSLPLLSALFAGTAVADSFVLEMMASDERAVPVTVNHPEGGCEACTLVVFSHGAYAAPERYQRILDNWAEADFVVVSPLHVDSELNPDRDNYERDQVLATRLEDIGLLLTSESLTDELAERSITLQEKAIAAGHSYGGLIAQIAGGGSITAQPDLPDVLRKGRERVLGIVALSPPGSMEGFVEDKDWEVIERPMLVVTGTTDIIPPFIKDYREHLLSFDASRRATTYGLVYDSQDHYFNGAFGRPKDDLTDADKAALAALNAACVDFMGDLVAGETASPETWLAKSTDQVQALAHQ